MYPNKQVEVMSSLLLQATGMQVTMSDDCKPLQLLKKDGSLYFEDAFVNQAKFEDLTTSFNKVTCMIRDCMFDLLACWLDRDNGRRKIITSYVRFCQNIQYPKSKRLPPNFTHVVIGGHFGIFAAYTVDACGEITLSGDATAITLKQKQ